MTALESALRTNPQPLLLFAALKDFSGENISFLTKVLEWKRGWSPSSPVRGGFLRRPSIYDVNNTGLQHRQFKCAVDIYASFVSMKYSDFPVNLSHQHLKELETLLEDAAVALYGATTHHRDAATPFNDGWDVHNSTIDVESSVGGKDGISINSTILPSDHNSTDHILPTALDLNNKQQQQDVVEAFGMVNVAEDKLPDGILLPENFGPDCFDHAEESIKYMVLTNTWPKFVNAGYANIQGKKSFVDQAKARLLVCHKP